MDHYGKQQANEANIRAYAQQTANAQAYPDAPTPRRSSLDEIGSRLSGAIHQASLLCEAVATLEGRLMGGCAGTLGGNDKAAQARPVPSGFVGQTNASLDELFSRLESCANTVSRLSDAI